MTLTTEAMQEIYEAAVHSDASGSESAEFELLCKLESVGGTSATIRKLIDMVRAANREARPVAYAVFADNGNIRIWSTDKGITENVGVPVPLYTAQQAPEITDEAIDRIVVPLSPDGLDEEKHHCEWHLYHDRERIRKELREYFAAPPAPANANPVAWEMRFWNSGHNMWYDWERITAEQHAEMSVQYAADNDYEFRVLYDSPPAPAVPDAVDYSDLDATSQDREVIEAIAECKGWNAYRAAMLAAAPEDL